MLLMPDAHFKILYSRGCSSAFLTCSRKWGEVGKFMTDHKAEATELYLGVKLS